MIWTPTGQRRAFVLAFLQVGTRRVVCSPCSFKSDPKWIASQAHAFIEQAREAGLFLESLVRDNDGMYVEAFEQVFKNVDCRVIPTRAGAQPKRLPRGRG